MVEIVKQLGWTYVSTVAAQVGRAQIRWIEILYHHHLHLQPPSSPSSPPLIGWICVSTVAAQVVVLYIPLSGSKYIIVTENKIAQQVWQSPFSISRENTERRGSDLSPSWPPSPASASASPSPSTGMPPATSFSRFFFAEMHFHRNLRFTTGGWEARLLEPAAAQNRRNKIPKLSLEGMGKLR